MDEFLKMDECNPRCKTLMLKLRELKQYKVGAKLRSTTTIKENSRKQKTPKISLSE